MFRCNHCNKRFHTASARSSHVTQVHATLYGRRHNIIDNNLPNTIEVTINNTTMDDESDTSVENISVDSFQCFEREHAYNSNENQPNSNNIHIEDIDSITENKSVYPVILPQYSSSSSNSIDNS